MQTTESKPQMGLTDTSKLNVCASTTETETPSSTNVSLMSSHITSTDNNSKSASPCTQDNKADIISAPNICSANTNTQEQNDTENKSVPAPPVEIKLFVGRVPRTYNEETLKPIFEEFGEVVGVIIIRDRDTGAHKGCAFVRMASITRADAAIRALNNVKILDASLGQLQVKYAVNEAERLGLPPDVASPGVDQAKLFVGSIPKAANEEEVKSVFENYGEISEIYLMRDETRQSKGCAFVKFAHKEEAFNAIACLNGKLTMKGGVRAMEVRFAENKKQGTVMAVQPSNLPFPSREQISSAWQEYFTGDGRPYYHNSLINITQWERPIEFESPLSQTHGPPGANVFIFHIPNEWTEHDLIAHFNQFGHILSARIATDKATSRNRGFGFVSYNNVQSAVGAVNSLNGFAVAGKRLKVKIKKGEEAFADCHDYGMPPSVGRQHSGHFGQFVGNGGGGSNMQLPVHSHHTHDTQGISPGMMSPFGQNPQMRGVQHLSPTSFKQQPPSHPHFNATSTNAPYHLQQTAVVR